MKTKLPTMTMFWNNTKKKKKKKEKRKEKEVFNGNLCCMKVFA
jgi:hypothetical protein